MSNKLVTFSDHDPPWMNDFVKNQIKWKHQIYKKDSHTYSDYLKLQEAATSVISELTSRGMDEYQNYIASRLNDPKANAKTYWSILKSFYNGKKIPTFLLS